MEAIVSGERGVLDTNVLVHFDFHEGEDRLPEVIEVPAIVVAELAYGVPMAADPVEASRRANRLAQVTAWVDPLPFGQAEAMKYGELAALVKSTGRSPKPRRLDLMIAATAAIAGLPLYTENGDDFFGLKNVVEVVELPSPEDD
jgi:predicted nucleic acid-binding protein